MKEVFVAFMTAKLKEQYYSLKEGKFEDKELYSFITRAIDDLKLNPQCGTKIPKNLWPKEYIQKYEITNLWKYDLPNGWRLIYTIEEAEIKLMNIILVYLQRV